MGRFKQSGKLFAKVFPNSMKLGPLEHYDKQKILAYSELLFSKRAAQSALLNFRFFSVQNILKVPYFLSFLSKLKTVCTDVFIITNTK